MIAMKKMIFTVAFAAATIGMKATVSQSQFEVLEIQTEVNYEKNIQFKDLPAAVRDAFKADGHEEKDVLKIVKTKIDKRFTEFKFLVKEEGQETEISYKAKLKE
ncbi:hypothetical protein CAP47_11800 [Psychroflexus sp. S27]|nr:hypothetical protein CAP47_11800 [Psychroflexus sp. S27]